MNQKESSDIIGLKPFDGKTLLTKQASCSPNISTKEQFIDSVKKWVYIDNQIKDINDKLKKYRDFKTKLTPIICTYIENNDSLNNKIDISNGELRTYEKKEYSPLTYAYIEKSLESVIPNKDHIELIIQHLKHNREIKISNDIRRTYYK